MNAMYENSFNTILLLASVSTAQFKAEQYCYWYRFGGGGLDGISAIPITLEFNFLKLSYNLKGGVFASTTEEMKFLTVSGEWSYTNIIVAAQSNYHFSPDDTFDFFTPHYFFSHYEPIKTLHVK